MQKVFKYYNDPGHGWLKVPLTLIQQLGIANEISRYSYINKGNTFLEEDCDAFLFINTMKKKGYTVSVREFHTNQDSKIRNYESYCV